MNKNIEKALLKATKRSTHKRHQTGCVLVTKAGSIISSGCAHSSSFRLSEVHSIHAEIHARWNGRFIPLEDATAYVMTIGRKSGNKAYSAPCLTCAITLRTAGVRKVVYSNGENHPMKHQWNELNLEDDLSNLKVYPTRN